LAQRYRLHLSDGTILLVDHDGLNTWLVDRKAMVQLEGSDLWLPLREFLAAERAAAFRATPRKTAKTREELPLIPPPPRKSDKEPLPPAAPEPAVAEPVPPAPAPQREEPAPRVVSPTPPPPPREEPPWARPATPAAPPSEPAELAPFDEALGVEPLAAGPAAPCRVPPSRPPLRPDESAPPIPLVPLDATPLTPPVRLAAETAAPRPSQQRAADDSFASDEGGGMPAAGTYGQDLPVIPLKPIAGEDRGFVSAWSESDAAHGVARGEQFEDRLDEDPVESLLPADAAFLRAAAVLGGFLSRVLDSLARFERRQRARRASARSAAAASRPADVPRAAVERRTFGQLLAAALPKPSRQPKAEAAPRVEEAPATDEPRTLGELLASAIPRPSRKPTVEPAPRAVEERAPASEPPSPKPPPAISELPVLRLAEIHEEEDAGDLYEGDEPGAGPGVLRLLWLWTRRLVALAVLVLGGTWAALTWKSWFPKAGEVGQKALTTLDEQVRSKEIESERAQALQAGVEQLPELAPETIRLLLASAARGELGVPELFQLAADAAGNGAASLTQDEARELTTLRDELLAGLHPTEREHVRDYERERAVGAAFPVEERAVIELVARGARLLPPERLARLQTLLGKAIAAGLKSPSPPAPS
jgi:hypothetical protein